MHLFWSQDGAAEAAADMLLRGHVPAAISRKWQPQPLGSVLLFHRKQVRDCKPLKSCLGTHQLSPVGFI